MNNDIMKISDAITDFSHWVENGNGWDGKYIYPFAAKVAYEIIVLCHYKDTPILTAKADLYVTGLWHTEEGTLLEREILGHELPIQELLEIAKDDYLKNH